MRRFFYVCLLLFMGCSAKVQLHEAAVTGVLPVYDISYENALMNTGSYNGQVYYLENAPKEYKVHFINHEGETVNIIAVPKGKGPGEITHNWRLKVFDDRVYLLDESQNKIVVYDLQGEAVDDIYFNVTGERIIDFVVFQDSIILEGIFKYKLLKLDKSTGDIVAELKYEKAYSVNEYFASDLRDGILACDDGRIYLGYYNKPFRIDVFSDALEQVDSFVKDYGDGYENCGWQRHPQGGVALMGHQMVYNMFVKGDEIYVPFGQGITYDEDGMHFMDVENAIYVMNKTNGKLKQKIWSEGLPMSGAGYGILDATENEITLFLIYDDDAIKAILDKTNTVYSELPRGIVIKLEY